MGQIKQMLGDPNDYLKYDSITGRYIIHTIPVDSYTLIKVLDLAYPHRTPTPTELKDELEVAARAGKRGLIDFLLNTITTKKKGG